MTAEEFEELGLTEKDGKLTIRDGELYFSFNAPIETIDISVTIDPGRETE